MKTDARAAGRINRMNSSIGVLAPSIPFDCGRPFARRKSIPRRGARRHLAPALLGSRAELSQASQTTIQPHSQCAS
jgi:hypothetical protein